VQTKRDSPQNGRLVSGNLNALLQSIFGENFAQSDNCLKSTSRILKTRLRQTLSGGFAIASPVEDSCGLFVAKRHSCGLSFVKTENKKYQKNVIPFSLQFLGNILIYYFHDC